jgi:transposase-like protein
MPAELDFTENNIAECLEQWKSEDEIWGDLTRAMRLELKARLEEIMEAERDLLTSCRRYERTGRRQDERAGYRPRSIITALGKVSGLRVPKLRKARFRTKLWGRYKRRITAIEVAIMESFLCGVGTRKMKRALRSILGDGGLSHASVSRIVENLNRSVRAWLTRPIEDDIEVLYLDGVFLRIKERGIKKRPTLFAMGITKSGQTRILGLWHAWQESADEWQAFTQSLWERGLKGSSLKIVVADGASAISSAVTLLWPEALIQSCVFHKMRNLVFALKRHPLKKLILKDAKVIWQATSRQEAMRRIGHFTTKWSKTCPRAVRNFIRDIDYCLSYFYLDPAMWRRIRTNNPLDRFFREIKRRVNPMGPFVDRKSASRILYAIAEAYEQDQRKRNSRSMKTAPAESREITFAHF